MRAEALACMLCILLLLSGCLNQDIKNTEQNIAKNEKEKISPKRALLEISAGFEDGFEEGNFYSNVNDEIAELETT